MKAYLTGGLVVLMLAALLVFEWRQSTRIEAMTAKQIAIAQLYEQQLQGQLADNAMSVREMRQQIEDLISSGALFPDKSKPAGDAVALAKAAELAGDRKLAEIYYLSAVNHAPSQFPILNSYAELVLGDKSATGHDLARLKSILQISLYQIAPGSIPDARVLLDRVVMGEEQLLAAQTPPSEPANWGGRLDQLATANTLGASWNDWKQVSGLWEGLNEIAESLREQQPESDLLKRVESELDLTQRVLSATRLTVTMDTIMTALKSSGNQPEKSVSLLQTAEATLGQLWGIDSADWPAELGKKIDAYPGKITGAAEAVAGFKSARGLVIIQNLQKKACDKNSIANKIPTASSGVSPLNHILKRNESCLATALATAQTVISIAGRNQVDGAIRDFQETIVAAKREQFHKYQKWALEQSKAAFVSWRDLLTVDEDEAWWIFEHYELATVDQSLLSPEVSRAFNDVLGKLTAEMSGKSVFYVQKDCAEATKKKLSDF